MSYPKELTSQKLANVIAARLVDQYGPFPIPQEELAKRTQEIISQKMNETMTVFYQP